MGELTRRNEVFLARRISLSFAIAAGAAGILAGYVSRRSHPRARSLAALQGLEWFLSAGGASLLASALRRLLEAGDQEVTERYVTVEQTVIDRGHVAD